MTDQDKISRLACAAAMDVPSYSPASSGPAIAMPPFAIRKTLCNASAMPLPFFPRVAFYQEARVLFGNRIAGMNHRRLRPHSRPTLAAASCCLMCSLAALFVTSPQGEESLAGVARSVIQASSDSGVMVSNTSD